MRGLNNVPSQPAESSGTANPIAIIIVGYGNPEDIVGCLSALSCANAEPNFNVFIAENGGFASADRLITTLLRSSVVELVANAPSTVAADRSTRTWQFRLQRPAGVETTVYVAEMDENLGYAGGINSWLRPLMRVPDWSAVWVLNPDTEPTPDALSHLESAARLQRKGMVGSCIVRSSDPRTISTQGLSWRKLTSSVIAVGRNRPYDDPIEPDVVEAQVSAPSGCSIYVERRLIDRIGLMEESYFLYCEDLEWGVRARAIGELSYAHGSKVPHHHGTTIGSSADRRTRSALSTYLTARNTILFVRRNYPGWLAWTLFVQLRVLAGYTAARAWRNLWIAFKGIVAGLRGETGPPSRL